MGPPRGGRQANDPCPQQRVSGPSRGARGTARSRSPPDTGRSSRRHPWTRTPGASPEGGQIASGLRRMHDVARSAWSQCGGAQRRGDLQVSTVLVVDDEERIRTLITRTLTAEGHSVRHRRRRRRRTRPAGRAGGRPGAAGPGHAAVPRAHGAVVPAPAGGPDPGDRAVRGHRHRGPGAGPGPGRGRRGRPSRSRSPSCWPAPGATWPPPVLPGPTTGSSRPAASGSTSTAVAPPWATVGCP